MGEDVGGGGVDLDRAGDGDLTGEEVGAGEDGEDQKNDDAEEPFEDAHWGPPGVWEGMSVHQAGAFPKKAVEVGFAGSGSDPGLWLGAGAVPDSEVCAAQAGRPGGRVVGGVGGSVREITRAERRADVGCVFMRTDAGRAGSVDRMGWFARAVDADGAQ